MDSSQTINFDLAGLDLILDKDGQVWFIEANSFPGFFEEQIGERKADLKAALGERLIAFLPQERRLGETFSSLLKSLTNFQVIYVKDDELPDFKAQENTKILAWKSIWKPFLSENNYVINSREISLLTSDKYETYKQIKNAGIKTPETFLVKSLAEIEKVFQEGDYKKLILKPRFGCRGENIEILKRDNYKEANINFEEIEYILQEFIEADHDKGLFCDYRVLVAGGKYIGAIMRESSKPVVSICLGGTLRQPPKEADQKFAKISEDIVKTLIESFALNEHGQYHYSTI